MSDLFRRVEGGAYISPSPYSYAEVYIEDSGLKELAGWLAMAGFVAEGSPDRVPDRVPPADLSVFNLKLEVRGLNLYLVWPHRTAAVSIAQTRLLYDQMRASFSPKVNGPSEDLRLLYDQLRAAFSSGPDPSPNPAISIECLPGEDLDDLVEVLSGELHDKYIISHKVASETIARALRQFQRRARLFNEQRQGGTE
jgi:hypothetical protein